MNIIIRVEVKYFHAKIRKMRCGLDRAFDIIIELNKIELRELVKKRSSKSRVHFPIKKIIALWFKNVLL